MDRKCFRQYQPFDRESYWGSHLGEVKQVKDLTDTHIVNLIQYVQKYPQFYDPEVLETFKKEAELRGLTETMKDRSQIPYQDRHGQWWIWDFDKNHPVIVGREGQRAEEKPFWDEDKPKRSGLASWLPSFFAEFLYGSEE